MIYLPCGNSPTRSPAGGPPLYPGHTAYRMQNATEEPPKPVMVGQNPPPGAVIYARHSDPQRFRRSDVCDFELDCRAALDDGGL
jgi:hypothetical protein